jgi:hypothetical protein
MKTLQLLTIASSLVFCALSGGAGAVPIYPPEQTFELGSFSGLPGNDSAALGRTVSPGDFIDTYVFNTTNRSRIAASITNSLADPTKLIDDFTLSFYKGDPGTGMLITSVTAELVPPARQEGGFGPWLEPIGNYYVVVSGMTNDTPTYGGSLSLSISAVPIPAALPLFGSAVLGLGTAGWSRRKRKQATA